MGCKTSFLYFVLLSLKICKSMDQASFYGNSYISVPFKEAKSSTDISFKFKTHLVDALIFLVAGTTDYCIVQLENGKIKININLGAGESELLSPSNVKFNDLKWHEVSIQRREANLSMTIDRSHRVQKHLPGKFFELNIHYGLFVGDNKNKNNTDIFFGHIEKFRGCIANLKYNDILVLDQARRRLSQSTVQGITWNCAAEFNATIDQPISFIEDDAYMVITHKVHYKELKIKFEIRTLDKDGIIFYNPGHKLKLNFFLIELNNYSIRSVIKIGDKILKIISKNIRVSDGHWHKVFFRLTPSVIELSVDEKINSEKNNHGHLFQLSESSYLGGLEISKRFRATQKGCSKSCDYGFKGCINDFSIFDSRKGFPDAHVTEGLLPGCVWHYPCLQNPCSTNSFCVQQGLDSFQCQCQEELCVNVNYTEGYKVFSKNSLATELELLSIEPLQVLEGQSEIITTKNLHMILDYQKYGVKNSGIIFFIIEGPLHGSITIDIWPHDKNAFSLFDVARDKVHYVHDGSENNHESIILEVEFNTAHTFTLPVYLQGKFRFTLPITVIPTNDAPVLDITDTTVFRTVQGTKKFITNEIFKAVDPDNSPSELIYTILKSEGGFFENYKNSGIKISSFSQEEVDEGHILYFDQSTSNISHISMQVSDGIVTSRVYQLKVSISPQYWRLEKNTGLIVLHQSSSIISPSNLSFTSNVAIPDYSALFTIIKKPRYGVVEVEKNINTWEASDSFTSGDLRQHRVRYRHVNAKPDFDEFHFRTLDKTHIYTFRLTFSKCTLYKKNIKTVSLYNDWEITISKQDLSFETNPAKADTSIHYVISKPPQYGFLFSSVSKYRLKACDMFTQEDIVSQNIKFRFFQKAYSDIQDTFTFAVLSPGCNNITSNLTFKYSPLKEDKSQVTVNLRHLDVDEGSSAIIEPSHLFLQADFVSNLMFNVTEKPRHGFLQLFKNEVIKNDTDYFTSNHLKNNILYYFHDGSETRSDTFTFLTLAIDEENFEYVGEFNIKVQLINDNSPIRVVDKIFHIVVGGERLLTGKNLKYIDNDLDTPTSSIVYTCRESSNGNFYNLKNVSKKITEFTQDDLDSNTIIFKHKGPEFGKVRLWVTDGKYHVNGILEVQASAPFIHISMNQKIIVELGKTVVITSDHLSFTTNLYALDKDVFYEVTNKPSFGKVVSSSNLKIVKNFTQVDINEGHISYWNENTAGNADEIAVRVRCRDAVNVAQLGVWILPASYWEPLEPRHLKPLCVEESTSVLLMKRNLEIFQPNLSPSSIIFYIVDMPEYGYITILSDAKSGNEPVNILSFSQDLINENKVLYIQSGANQTKDKIVFNVTNGIVWKNNVQLNIEIIPERIYLGSNNLIVNEGGSGVITESHLFVITDYYKTKILLYTIKENVKYGCIQVHKRCMKSKVFSHKELQAGVVQYCHDGTENLEDQVIIIGDTGQKKSVSVILKIIVLPINDQKPKLVNNTGLVMWEGGVAVITNEMLAAVDEDRPKETLKYHVQNCWWGSVSLISERTAPINYFTQELIDKRMVIFRHQNGTEARFKFNVSDGLSTTKDYMFYIKTKPVQLKLISKPLHIFPLQKKYLSSNHLLTLISDVERKIYYEVNVSPTLGRLMMESEKAGIFKVVSSFTQDDLNNSRVFYEHTHQFSDLYANDSFMFNVKAHLAPKLTNQVLRIDISVSSGGLDAYVNIPKISVDEGGMTNIPLNLSGVVSFLENHAGLRSPIIHASALTPLHGQVFLQNMRNMTTFTQQQLESGQVYYEHDHSDSLGDNLHFSLYLIPGYVTLCNVTVPIIVNPINDQPFNLVTPAPSLVVVQGENHTIRRHELATEDADTPPSKLKYDLISGPSHGKLILLPEKVSVTYFTQSDIDDNRLVYIHDGSVLTDSFHFRIWDGKFRPEFNLFNVMVVPINITIISGMPIYLLQGTDVELLSEKQFFIQTNADRNKIQFTLRRSTKHGVLYKDPFYKDKPITTFSYIDLLNGKIMYLQTDMTTANDSFTVVGEIFCGNNTFGNEVEVNIKVKPFMHIYNFTIKAAEINKITLRTLDATPLAKITNSNPRYTIIKLPKYGQLRKIIRSSGEKRNVLDTVINTFTHEEVQSGLIYMAIKDVEVPWDGIQDNLVFTLAASIFQPAVGELKVNIKSPLNNDISSTLPGPSDPAGHEGGLHLSSPNDNKDYLLIVTMVLGVVILGIAVIVVIKCRTLNARISKEEQCIQPIPLPRPPDRLMSSSPNLKSSHEGFATHTSGVLPHCKVTPLEIKSTTDSPSPHPCYPYGAEDQPDDWSSMDASSSDPPCPTKNIMLRRNQYWV